MKLHYLSSGTAQTQTTMITDQDIETYETIISIRYQLSRLDKESDFDYSDIIGPCINELNKICKRIDPNDNLLNCGL